MHEEIANLRTALARCNYIADESLATTLVLMDKLSRPVLVEGEAGVGKTAVAAAMINGASSTGCSTSSGSGPVSAMET